MPSIPPTPAHPLVSRASDGGPVAASPPLESPELAHLLHTGPFHEALRAAIAASGLSLDRLQDRLRRLGKEVSLASLSSWQSGRYRPERPRSLDALRAMEQVLAVPDGALVSLLGPRRPRGRWLSRSRDGRPLEEVLPHEAVQALGGVDTRWDASFTRISCQNQLRIDEHGGTRSMWTRHLLRANRDGPDRWVTFYQAEQPGPTPELKIAAPLRLGAVATAAESGLLVAELLFDRPLDCGETIIVEYTVEHRGPRPVSTHIETALHLPVREYVLEARFDPSALPASCHSYYAAEDDPVSTERQLRIDTAGSVHAVALRTRPCRFGIRWSWEEPATAPSD